MARVADYSNTHKYSNRRSFDGQPVPVGMVLVPFRKDLYDLKVADEIVKEPLGGAHRDPDAVYHALRGAIRKNLRILSRLSGSELVNRRIAKFRAYGIVDTRNS